MSSTSAKAGGNSKRPLSGYNLFYRYKRIKVLEAIARPTNGSGRNNEAVIREVMAALPGLEGVSPTSPIFGSSPARVDEFRVAAIQKAMEGKLFPNENGRNRLHRKVHGMGFVEMGRVMRQLWGQADKLTKEVFFELAEEGKVQHKRLMAEHKLPGERENPPTPTVNSKVDREAADVDATVPMKTEEEAKRAKSSPIPRQPQLSLDPKPEGRSASATENPPPTAASPESGDHQPEKGSRLGYGPRQRVSNEFDFTSKPLANPSTISAPTGTKVAEPGYRRLVSKELIPRDISPSEPPTVKAAARPDAKDTFASQPAGADEVRPLFWPGDDSLNAPAAAKTETSKGRERWPSVDAFRPLKEDLDGTVRTPPVKVDDAASVLDPGTGNGVQGRGVSPDVCPVVHCGTGSVPVAGNGSTSTGALDHIQGLINANLKLQRMVLRNAIEKIKEETIQKNSLLPPEMRVDPQDYVTSSSNISVAPSVGGAAGDSCIGDVVKEKEYTQDFVKMIGKLVEAIDDKRTVDLHKGSTWF